MKVRVVASPAEPLLVGLVLDVVGFDHLPGTCDDGHVWLTVRTPMGDEFILRRGDVALVS